MKKLIFISQPMRGRSKDSILKERALIKEKAEAIMGKEFELIDSMYHVDPPTKANPDLWGLSESISYLSLCDLAIFGPEWYGARGCRIEHECAKEYGLKILEITDL